MWDDQQFIELSAAGELLGDFRADSESYPARWTRSQAPEVCFAPRYEGGTRNPQTGEVSGGAWMDPGAPDEIEKAQREFQRRQVHLTSVIQGRLDEIAAERGYDSILSLCSYATSSVPKFLAEGQAGVDIRDQCWLIGYAVLEQVARGEVPWPTDEEALAMMPAMQWPE